MTLGNSNYWMRSLLLRLLRNRQHRRLKRPNPLPNPHLLPSPHPLPNPHPKRLHHKPRLWHNLLQRKPHRQPQ